MIAYYREDLSLRKARKGDILRTRDCAEYVRVERWEGSGPDLRLIVRRVVWAPASATGWAAQVGSVPEAWHPSNTLFAVCSADLAKFVRRQNWRS